MTEDEREQYLAEDEANCLPPLAQAPGSAKCDVWTVGGTPVRAIHCDREQGHSGWHHEFATNSAWPPHANEAHSPNYIIIMRSVHGAVHG